MAKIQWAPGISTVSGALKKINKKSPHAADQQMLLATHRVAPSTSTNCNRIYLRGLDSVTRSTPVTESERIVRQRLAAVSRGISTLKKNVQQMTAAVAAYNAQKDEPGGFKTLYQFLWHKVANELEG